MRWTLLAATLPLVAMANPSKDTLTRVAGKKVFFAHQSVGENLLAGVEALAREAGVPLRVAEGAGAGAFSTPGLVHAKVGKNEDPDSKLAAFAQAVDGPAAGAELALVKLCYVDFDQKTDGKALFERYQKLAAELKARHPLLQLVHVTAPLTTVQGGLKGWLKNLLGRAAGGERENQARHTYNALLREKYAGKEPLFDLAAVEAGQGEGACRFTRDGKSWPCLRPGLTDDGGHLNAAGQREAAAELLRVLAQAPAPSPQN